MDSNWAGEQLQTIRTLMERSAIYRRALAPIMLVAGTWGVIAALIGLLFHIDSSRAFCLLWLATAVCAVLSSLLITRRQAIKDSEAFWSPPTRRVVQALAPPLIAGLVISGFPLLSHVPSEYKWLSIYAWILFYGLALHSAGFFMPRGIKFFGWLFIAFACISIYMGDSLINLNPHVFMGFFFGALHLAYGIYLYLTEKGKNAA
jgi:hypothetical protein